MFRLRDGLGVLFILMALLFISGCASEPLIDVGAEPTVLVIIEPTAIPEEEPTTVPEEEPTAVSEEEPTVIPEEEPTAVPEEEPTTIPEEEPTVIPEEEPTTIPEEPTAVPEEPTAVPEEEPTTIPEEPTTIPEEPTAIPEESTVISTEPVAEISVWFVGRDQNLYGLLSNELFEFEAEANIKAVPLSPIANREQLDAMLDAGETPDVLLMVADSREFVFSRPDFLMNLSDTDLLSMVHADALTSVRLDEQLYGLPWQRLPNCSPFYANMFVPNEASEPDAANALLTFLLSADSQRRVFTQGLGYLPVSNEVFSAQSLSCPRRGLVVQNSLDMLSEARGYAESVVTSSSIAGIVAASDDQNGEQKLDPGRAQPLVQYNTAASQGDVNSFSLLEMIGNTQLIHESFEQTPDPTLAAVFVPVALPYSEIAFERELLASADGIYVGAILGVGAKTEYAIGDVPFTVEPQQNYLINLQPITDNSFVARATIIDETGGVIAAAEVELISLNPFPDSRLVEEENLNWVTVEINSCTVYYWIDNRLLGIRFISELHIFYPNNTAYVICEGL